MTQVVGMAQTLRPRDDGDATRVPRGISDGLSDSHYRHTAPIGDRVDSSGSVRARTQYRIATLRPPVP